MTAINIVNIAPPTLTGLTATGTNGGILYEWNTDNTISNLWGVELWTASTDDRSTATLITTETGGSYYNSLAPSTTEYAWIKSKDTFNNNNGAWEPVSSTAGVTATSNALEIPSVGLPVNNTVTSTSYNINPSMSAFDTWYSAGYLEFTAPTQGLVTAFIFHLLVSSDVTLTTDGDIIKVWGRLRLYNQTDSVNVEGVLKKYISTIYMRLSGVVTQRFIDQPIQENFFISSDKLGITKTGKTYRLYVEYMKEQTSGTDGTIVLASNISDKQITAGATYS